MVTISSVDDPASHPLAGNAAAGRASQPPATNPAVPLFDNHSTAPEYVAGTTAGSSQPPPPYAPAPATYGGEFNLNPSFSGYTMDMDTFYALPRMTEPSHNWYPSYAAPAPIAQYAMAPPMFMPTQTTTAQQPFFYPPTQSQQVVTDSAAEDIIVQALLDAEKAQEAIAPAPRRRGRPRKNVAPGAAAATKPALKPKRATVRSKRAASQQAASGTEISGQVHQVPLPLLPDQKTNGVVEVQVQHPDQETTSDQTAPCANSTALLCQEQWPLQPTVCNSLSVGVQAAAVFGREVMQPYAETSAEGVRFQPTDEELIFYLRLKYAGREMPVDFFKEFDVYQAYPEISRDVCGVVNGFWYAFSPRDRKYKNGVRPARSVVDASSRQLGYWKSNIKLAPVRSRVDGSQIGTVASLTFHLGHQPHGAQTPWEMKEYAIPENQHAPDGSAMRLNDWVVCKLFYKERVIAARKKKGQLGEVAVNDNSGAGGDEGTQMGSSVDQTSEDSEQDLYLVNFDKYLHHN